MAKNPCISRDIYNIVKDDYLEPFLQERGFIQTRKEEFYRIDGDVCWRVCSDFKRAGPIDEGILSLTVGIGFFSLNRFLKTFPLMSQVIKDQKGKPCACARDVSLMTKGGPWEEWYIRPSSDPADVARSALGHLSAEGFDFFEKYGTLDKFLEAMERDRYVFHGSAFYDRAAIYWRRKQPVRFARLFVACFEEMEKTLKLRATSQKPINMMAPNLDYDFESLKASLSNLPALQVDDRTRAEEDSFLRWIVQQPTDGLP